MHETMGTVAILWSWLIATDKSVGSFFDSDAEKEKEREKLNPQNKFWDLNSRPSEFQSDALTTKPLGLCQRSSTQAACSMQHCVEPSSQFQLIPSLSINAWLGGSQTTLPNHHRSPQLVESLWMGLHAGLSELTVQALPERILSLSTSTASGIVNHTSG